MTGQAEHRAPAPAGPPVPGPEPAETAVSGDSGSEGPAAAAGDEAAARAIERRVLAALDAMGVPYEVMRIDPAHADTAVFCERYGVPLAQSANTILVASRREPRRYAACVVLATTRLDVNHAVRRLMGVSRLSFASAEETRALTEMLLGGVTAFALPPDLPLYVDARVMAPPWVVLGGGSRSCKVQVAPEALRRLPGASVVPDLAVPA